MRLIATAAVLGMLVVAPPAMAQLGSPQFGNPGFESPNPQAETNTTDVLVARLVGASSMAEVQFGRLASERSSDNAVRDFARRMVEDHTGLNSQLAQRASEADIPLPQQLDAGNMETLQELQALRDLAFDLAYARSQVTGHQKTIILLQYEIGNGQNNGLKQFAMDALPMIMDHLELAKNLNREIEGQATVARGTAGGPPAGGAPAPRNR